MLGFVGHIWQLLGILLFFFFLVKTLKNVKSILILRAIPKEGTGWIWPGSAVCMTWDSRIVRYH